MTDSNKSKQYLKVNKTQNDKAFKTRPISLAQRKKAASYDAAHKTLCYIGIINSHPSIALNK